MKILTFGEIMLRLKAPGQERFFQSPTFEATLIQHRIMQHLKINICMNRRIGFHDERLITTFS